MRLSDKYPFLANYFTQAVSQTDRALPQSILFYGSDLNAQYLNAQEIARLLNCTGDKSDECDCLNCKWINEGTHPTVITISRIDSKPEKDESKTVISVKQSQMIKEQLEQARFEEEKFTREGNLEKAAELKYSTIPALQKELDAALAAEK